MNIQDVITGSGGTLLNPSVGVDLQQILVGVGTDSRKDLSGQLFIALRGDSFDAHDFLKQAVEKSARAILVHRVPDGFIQFLDSFVHAGGASASGFSQPAVIKVDDTLLGLQKLGRYWRRKMPAKILAVTGTNGKTTTKEFSAAIISAHKQVQFSHGSFNNHWGVPITLLSIEPQHEVAIVEMGMNHPGEIKTLVGIAEPDVVMVTMVGRGHLEGVGSIEGVANAKEEMYQSASENAVMIFNLGNAFTQAMYDRARMKNPTGRVWSFCRSDLLDANQTGGSKANMVDVSFELVHADDSHLRIRGVIEGVSGECEVPVFGAHNVENLMAASCFALAAGLTAAQIWLALPRCRSGWGRNQWVETKLGARVLFDAYNANPESMRAALENFSRLTVPGRGRKLAVIGEMREMGEHAADVHNEMGRLAAAMNFDQVLFVGPSHREFASGFSSTGQLASPSASLSPAEVESASVPPTSAVKSAAISKKLLLMESYSEGAAKQAGFDVHSGDWILMKGSRGMALERVLNEWQPIDFKLK